MLSSESGGPTPRAWAWRRFIIETLVCLVLLAAMVEMGRQARDNIFAGPAILALAGAIVAIVRHRW